MTRTVAAAEAARWIERGEARLIDVRSPAEFAAEHIAAARSLPLDTLPGSLQALGLPADRKLVVQCLKGGRGATACAAVGRDFPEAWNLEGGIEAWKAAGHPVVRHAAGLPVVR